MGLKYTAETVGDIKKYLNSIPDDIPFQFLFDGADYRKLSFQSLYDHEPERYIKIEPVEE